MRTARIWSVRLAALAVLLTATSAAADPATVCDNEAASGPSSVHVVPGVVTVGIYVGWSQDTWVSVDLPGEDLDTLVGIDTEKLEHKAMLCVRGPGAGNRHVSVTLGDPRPGIPGHTVRLDLCEPVSPGTGGDPLCTQLLGETGVELVPNAPLFTCVWINGFQQNPGCPG